MFAIIFLLCSFSCFCCQLFEVLRRCLILNLIVERNQIKTQHDALMEGLCFSCDPTGTSILFTEQQWSTPWLFTQCLSPGKFWISRLVLCHIITERFLFKLESLNSGTHLVRHLIWVLIHHALGPSTFTVSSALWLITFISSPPLWLTSGASAHITNRPLAPGLFCLLSTLIHSTHIQQV